MANRGRPKKHFDKRQNCAVRLTPQQRDRVIESAKEHKRSISEEIGWRLERSFLQDDLVAAVREEIAKAIAPQQITTWPLTSVVTYTGAAAPATTNYFDYDAGSCG